MIFFWMKFVLAFVTVRLVPLLRVGRVEVIIGLPTDDGSISILPCRILLVVIMSVASLLTFRIGALCVYNLSA